MDTSSYSSSDSIQLASCPTSPVAMLTINDYLDGLYCLHEAQKVNSTIEEILIKLRLYLEDKVGGQNNLNKILTLIKIDKIIDFSNNKEFEYCTSLLPLFMVYICLENSVVEQK